MKHPETMNHAELVRLAQVHKSMIAGLQKQLKAALESNARLYLENKRLREGATETRGAL